MHANFHTPFHSPDTQADLLTRQAVMVEAKKRVLFAIVVVKILLRNLSVRYTQLHTSLLLKVAQSNYITTALAAKKKQKLTCNLPPLPLVDSLQRKQKISEVIT